MQKGCVIHLCSEYRIKSQFDQTVNIDFDNTQQLPCLLPKSYENIVISEKCLPIKLQNVTCQVLRSASHWSISSLDRTMVEHSIHEAYIETITNANHYVYIENQFFVSIGSDSSKVKNRIADAIYQRIMRAVQ